MPDTSGPLDVEQALESRGKLSRGFLSVGPEEEREAGRLPVAVLAGIHGGPTVWINASIHGDEYLGAASIARLLPGLDPAQIRGSLIATPVLNVPAFRGMRRTDPAHDVDLNRAWTGATAQGDSARVREVVSAEILSRSDAVLDLHSGGNRYLQTPFTVYPRWGGKAEADSGDLAKACGISLIWADGTSLLEGALIHAAARKGLAAVLIEVGGEGKVEEHWVHRTVAAVRGALAHVGLLPERPRFLDEYRVFRACDVVRNRAEGLWEPRAEPGDDVAERGVLGRVLDVFGDEAEVVESPRTAAVLGLYTYGYVPMKELIAELGHDFRTEGGPA